MTATVTRRTKSHARLELQKRNVPMGEDFHALNYDQVTRVLAAAKAHGYRKTSGAPGSLARCFYAYANR